MQLLITFVIALAVLANTCRAQVTAFADPTQWQFAVGAYITIDFTDYPEFTVITDQYADLGVTFTDGNDFIGVSSFPTDTHGLASTDGFGNLGTIHMSFTQPQHWLAFDFLDNLQLDLYNDGELIFTSNQYSAGFTPFVGFVSTDPFDAAIVRDYNDPTVAIDNIHFGPPIPAPGAVALFGLARILIRRRQRCTD
jgi:hypothetical protein